MSNGRTVIFRADASATIGGGHVMRCLALAQALLRRGWQVTFAASAETSHVVPALASAGVDVVAVEWADAQAAIDDIKKSLSAADVMIVDHYGLDARFERASRALARTVMAIDDLADRPHDCDVLLDQTPGRAAQGYDGLVPKDATVLTGPSFALLRPEFIRARKERRVRTTIDRILISFGASDPTGLTLPVLEKVSALFGGLIDVVLGANVARGPIEAAAQRIGSRVSVHINTPRMADLMLQADLAIGAGGTSSWERCCLGLPALIFVVAENQREGAAALDAAGAAVVLDGLDDIARVLPELQQDAGRVRAMSVAAARLCDGFGSERVAALLTAAQSIGGRAVYLRAVTADDAELLYQWQANPDTRRYARNPAVPTLDSHIAWLTRKLDEPGCLFHIVMHGSEPVGSLRLDALDGERTAYEISIVTAPGHRGKGVGLAALHLASTLVPEAELHAEVKPENAASQRLFKAAGFVQVSPSQFVRPTTCDAVRA